MAWSTVIGLPFCNEVPGGEHPPLRDWSDKDLAYGRCPRCGSPDPSGKAWRILVARRLLREHPGERRQ
jgi:hypothetical protein